ncbi:MAG: DUF4825 domain-containing protein [Lachnospiraceae bacterium]|nr:DUF4825 domain-containing protein [Lachnospiraceae bacterium]
MMSKIPCEVIRDLLPLYIDGLTSDKTNAEIDEHIGECHDCKAILDAMRTPEGEDMSMIDENKELDFLKKNKKRNRLFLWGSIIVAMVLVCTILFVRLYITGDKINADSISVQTEVDGNRVIVDGSITDDLHDLSSVSVSDDGGTVNITVHSVQESPIRTNELHVVHDSSDKVVYVYLNDSPIWVEGVQIRQTVSKVYNTRHAYMGNMSDNIKTANALHMYDIFGTFKNELESSDQPYVWHIKLDNDIASDYQASSEENMRKNGYIMLGVIQNLDEICFEYTVDGKAVTKTLTADEASEFFGNDIKGCYDDIRTLQLLYDKLGM